MLFSQNHQRKLKITIGINCYKKRKLKFYDSFAISDRSIEMDNEIKISLMEKLWFFVLAIESCDTKYLKIQAESVIIF